MLIKTFYIITTQIILCFKFFYESMLRLLQINTNITENINVYVAGGLQTCSNHITKLANNVKTSVTHYSVFARYVVWWSPLSVINTNGYRDLTYPLQ